MNVRVLTRQEILDLKEGTEAVYIGNSRLYYGHTLIRTLDFQDDTYSSYFEYRDSDGDKNDGYFGEGEVGIREKELSPLLFDSSHMVSKSAEQVFQPDLDKRKNGKILVHLFDQGFPNAIFEISKVMTWAGDVKGYKPHDWKNLPDAENALEGAASRHRMEHNKERQGGAKLIDIVDHESKLLHKAHEAFNVLAELEMILTQRIQ